jgi:hypothetical protein
MRDDQRFEIERAFDLLPHVVGASWAVIWYRLNGVIKPTREEFRNKVLEYFDLLNPLFRSFPDLKEFREIIDYTNQRRTEEIEQIKNGLNKEIEKRYERYIDYG